MKDKKTSILIAIGCILFMTLIVCSALYTRTKVVKYNKGICPNCKRQYETYTHFEKGDGKSYTTYSCKSCGEKDYVETRLIEK